MAKKQQTGFTMVQLIMTVSIILIVGVSVLLWIDPVARINTAKDTRRQQDISVLSLAISDYTRDHNGALPILGAVTSGKKVLCTSQSGSNLSCDGSSLPCIRIADQDFYTNYLKDLPIDPDKTSNTDTGYYLKKGATGQLVIGACTNGSGQKVVSTSTAMVTCDAYAGGNCWIIDDSYNQTCNAACADVGLRCVSGVSYGPDVDSGDSNYCALGKALSGDCSQSCSLATSGYPPYTSDDWADCWTQTTVVFCGQSPGANKFAICPCQ